MDDQRAPGMVLLHQHVVKDVEGGGFCFINVPAAHMLALDLGDATMTDTFNIDEGPWQTRSSTHRKLRWPKSGHKTIRRKKKQEFQA